MKTHGEKRVEEISEYEALARRFIEGVGGLFDLYKYEMAVPTFQPPEVEAAAWVLHCLTTPKNRDVLVELLRQSFLREEAMPKMPKPLTSDGEPTPDGVKIPLRPEELP